jgi:hypothetical protein
MGDLRLISQDFRQVIGYRRSQSDPTVFGDASERIQLIEDCSLECCRT